jgi:protein TonB
MLHFQKTAQQETMQVELAPASKLQPEPEPVKPQAVPKQGPVTHHVIAPSQIKAPVAHSQPEPVVEPNPPAVITAPTKLETPPTFTAPPPPPPEPVTAEPSQQDIDAARNLYGNLLGREIAKHKQYPKIAQMRGWQGEVVVDIQLDKNGNVLSSNIQKHSGYEALDKQALEMVKKASPFPAPPEALRGNSFNILVPVSFRLE